MNKKVRYKHKENSKDPIFLWIQFKPDRILEVDFSKIPKPIEEEKIYNILKKLYPTIERIDDEMYR